MIVYTCMCEQRLDCEYVIILILHFGAMQFSLIFNEYILKLHEILLTLQILVLF